MVVTTGLRANQSPTLLSGGPSNLDAQCCFDAAIQEMRTRLSHVLRPEVHGRRNRHGVRDHRAGFRAAGHRLARVNTGGMPIRPRCLKTPSHRARRPREEALSGSSRCKLLLRKDVETAEPALRTASIQLYFQECNC